MTPSGGSPPRAVIFDLDGTVADTLEPTFLAFQDAVAPALGRRPSREEILERFGPADERIVADWVGPVRGAEAVRRLHAAYDARFRDAAVFPGMLPLLDRLRAGGRVLGLFTGRGRTSTTRLLGLLDLDARFHAIVCGDEIARSKPAPDGLTRILADLDARPDEAVYVGDTVKDLQSAEAAGITFLGALWGSPEAGRLREAAGELVEVVSDLDERLG
jgi:HAD superfamily hydrolase (TIGR01549 family)